MWQEQINDWQVDILIFRNGHYNTFLPCMICLIYCICMYIYIYIYMNVVPQHDAKTIWLQSTSETRQCNVHSKWEHVDMSTARHNAPSASFQTPHVMSWELLFPCRHGVLSPWLLWQNATEARFCPSWESQHCWVCNRHETLTKHLQFNFLIVNVFIKVREKRKLEERERNIQ